MACTISSNPVQLVPTSVDHVIHVADNMREIDVRELQAFRKIGRASCRERV